MLKGRLVQLQFKQGVLLLVVEPQVKSTIANCMGAVLGKLSGLLKLKQGTSA